MKILSAVFAMVAAVMSAASYADADKGKITIEKGMYYYDGKMLKRPEMLDLLKSVPEAESEVSAGNNLFAPAMVLAAGGGALVGWQLGTSIGGGEANWGVAIAGVALAGTGIYLGKLADNHYRKAVDLFNARGSAMMERSWDVAIAPQAVHVVWRF